MSFIAKRIVTNNYDDITMITFRLKQKRAPVERVFALARTSPSVQFSVFWCACINPLFEDIQFFSSQVGEVLSRALYLEQFTIR